MGSGPPGHRLAESIPWNQFLGSLKVLKYRLCSFYFNRVSFFASILPVSGINRVRFASIFLRSWISRLQFALSFLLYGISRTHFTSIFLISGISRGRFASIFVSSWISRVRFALIFKIFGISQVRFAFILKKCQDQSFVSLRFDIFDIATTYHRSIETHYT